MNAEKIAFYPSRQYTIFICRDNMNKIAVLFLNLFALAHTASVVNLNEWNSYKVQKSG